LGEELQNENCKLQKANMPGSSSKSEIRNPKSEIAPWPLIEIYALATSYLLLFNPRTENNSYLMLSPVIAVFCARAWVVEHRAAKACWLCAAAVAIFGGHDFCNLVTPQSEVVWVCPLVSLAFVGVVIHDVMTQESLTQRRKDAKLNAEA